MAPSPFAELDGENYVSLETFKRSGEGVKTPVWFARHDDVLYVYTEADSWKVKRIRNNPRVRVAACGIRGEVKGPWFDGTASIIGGDERLAADKLLDRKYLLKRLGNLVTRLTGRKREWIRVSARP